MTPVVLVPKGHAGEAKGMLEVELAVGEQLGAERVGRVLGKIAEALGLEAEVDPWRLYDEEVVLDLASQRMWTEGVEIALPEKSWRYVEYVAKSDGKAVTTKELGNYVTRGDYPDASARKIRAAIEKQMKQRLAAAGADGSVAERLIASEGRQGVRFGVSVRVLGGKSDAYRATG
jgi:DNA-binding response OmpR family regulator